MEIKRRMGEGAYIYMRELKVCRKKEHMKEKRLEVKEDDGEER